MSSLYKILIHLSEVDETIGKVHCGLLSIDLNKKKIYCGKYLILDNGKLMVNKIITNKNVYNFNSFINKEDLKFLGEDFKEIKSDPYTIIEKLFDKYYNSIPNYFSDQRKTNIICKPLKDISLKDMESEENRNRIQTILEGYILLAGLSGWIKWENEKYFYKTFGEKKLILLKDWVI